MTAPTARQLDAAALTAILRGHYCPPNRPAAGVFAAEVESPCGRRRADALWMPTTIAGGHQLIGHELKVSRSDVLAELADPTKAEAWARYCGRWWLVVADPALVDGLDVPEAWGVMAPPSGRRTRSMTILKPAPQLAPVDPAPGLRRLLAWQLYRTDDLIGQLRHELAGARRDADYAGRQLEEARAAGGHRGSPHAARVAGILAAAGKRLRAEGMWDQLDDELVVEAIVDAMATRRAADHVRRAIAGATGTLERALDPLRFVRDDVERAARLGLDQLAAAEDPR